MQKHNMLARTWNEENAQNADDEVVVAVVVVVIVVVAIGVAVASYTQHIINIFEHELFIYRNDSHLEYVLVL